MKKHILIIVVFIFGCFGIDGTGDAWAEAGIVSEYDESIPNEYYASYYPQPGEPTGYYTVEDLINSSPFLYWDGMLETGAVAEGCCLFDIDADGRDEVLLYACSDVSSGYCWAIYSESEEQYICIARSAKKLNYGGWELGISPDGVLVHSGSGGQGNVTMDWNAYIFMENGQIRCLYEECSDSYVPSGTPGIMNTVKEYHYYINGVSIEESEAYGKYGYILNEDFRGIEEVGMPIY